MPLNNYIFTKQQLHDFCTGYINNRIDGAKQAIANAQQASAEETKSSAGDKYETGRAMMQQEIERYTTQLNEAMRAKAALDHIKYDAQCSAVAVSGSLVLTTNGNFYLAIGAGTATINNVNYFTISPASPVGLQLKGKKAGDTVMVNHRSYLLTEIY